MIIKTIELVLSHGENGNIGIHMCVCAFGEQVGSRIEYTLNTHDATDVAMSRQCSA